MEDIVKYHECGNENVIWDKGGYKLAGLGETLERGGYCKNCKKRIKEVWTYSCELVDK